MEEKLYNELMQEAENNYASSLSAYIRMILKKRKSRVPKTIGQLSPTENTNTRKEILKAVTQLIKNNRQLKEEFSEFVLNHEIAPKGDKKFLRFIEQLQEYNRQLQELNNTLKGF